MDKIYLKRLLWLFEINMFISAFTVGGGYVVITMIRKYFVLKKQLFSEEELLEMAAIAQSSPGAIAINFAALAGYKVSGLMGAFISCIGAVIPPFIILSLVSYFYEIVFSHVIVRACLRGMQVGVALLILDVVYSMCKIVLKQKDVFYICMIPLSFVLSYIMNVNVMLIVVMSGLFSFGYYLWGNKQ